METAVLHFGWNAPFFGALLSIILIDVVLSGDNSIVIAMAVHTLSPEKRKWGLLGGAGAAAAIRVLFTFIASRLLGTPYLKLAGGLLLLWIALKLLSENEEANAKHPPAKSLFHAVWIITLADITMSLDNVLGVAGAARGSIPLLWIGLGISIPLVVFASGMLSRLMDRFPWIVVLGAAILGKVGGEMIAGDPVFSPHLSGIPHVHSVFALAGIVLVLGFDAWLRRKKAKIVSKG